MDSSNREGVEMDGSVEIYYHNNNDTLVCGGVYMYALFKYVHIYIYIYIIVSLSFTGVAILSVRIKKESVRYRERVAWPRDWGRSYVCVDLFYILCLLLLVASFVLIFNMRVPIYKYIPRLLNDALRTYTSLVQRCNIIVCCCVWTRRTREAILLRSGNLYDELA